MPSVLERKKVAWALVVLNAIFLAWLLVGPGRTDVVVAVWGLALFGFALVYLAVRQKGHRALRREDVRRAESGYTTFGNRQVDDAVDRTRTPPPPYMSG